MSAWFADRLLPRVLRSEAPILVFVADNLESMVGLRDVAAETIELRPVSRDAVEEHLRAAGPACGPRFPTASWLRTATRSLTISVCSHRLKRC